MNLLIIYTGGTIGSSYIHETDDSVSGYIGLAPEASEARIERVLETYSDTFTYETIRPINIHSENSTGGSISEIVNCIYYNINYERAYFASHNLTSNPAKRLRGYNGSKSHYNKNRRFDGIIVTHGTDTLQYTAAAAGYALGLCDIPVCFVSGDYPIEDPRSNALVNLDCALRFIRDTQARGVWVIYRNQGDSVTMVHRATRLLAHQTFSGDLHGCISNPEYGYYGDNDSGFTPNPAYGERPDEIHPFGELHLSDICTGIMRIVPYVGMVYPTIPDGVRYIVHESFHSGTINTACADYASFFKEAYERDIRVYLTGCMDGAEYESTALYDRLHIHRVRGIAPIALYMKLWIADSYNYSKGSNTDSDNYDIGLTRNLTMDDILMKSLCGDIA